MAYDDWPEDLQALWDSTPGTAPGYMDAWERAYAEEEFERGFRWTGAEYDEQNIDPDQVTAARDNFFTFMGINPRRGGGFDWGAWRAMHEDSPHH